VAGAAGVLKPDFTVNAPAAGAHWIAISTETHVDSTSLPLVSDSPHRAAGDLINDYRARRAFEEEERAQRRRIQLEEQRSDLNPPDVRIRAWEKVHGLRMPSDTTHPILDVIAGDTRLTLVEVHGEQQARVAETARRKQQKASAATPAQE
jgi:hypothetical protein